MEKRLDSATDPRKEYSVYLISWHHLEVYMSRLVATQVDVAAYKASIRKKHSPFKVYRSKVFKLKVLEERLEFFAAVASLYLKHLRRFSHLQEDIDHIYEDRV